MLMIWKQLANGLNIKITSYILLHSEMLIFFNTTSNFFIRFFCSDKTKKLVG